MAQRLEHVTLAGEAEGTRFVWPEDEEVLRGIFKAISNGVI